MSRYAVNCLPLSDSVDSRTVRIRRDVEDVAQTLGRLERMLSRAKSAALRNSDNAERDIVSLKDQLYTVLSDHMASEKDWEK